jgi:hypothetical protein
LSSVSNKDLGELFLAVKLVIKSFDDVVNDLFERSADGVLVVLQPLHQLFRVDHVINVDV